MIQANELLKREEEKMLPLKIKFHLKTLSFLQNTPMLSQVLSKLHKNNREPYQNLEGLEMSNLLSIRYRFGQA